VRYSREELAQIGEENLFQFFDLVFKATHSSSQYFAEKIKLLK